MITRTYLLVAVALAAGCGSGGSPGADAASPDGGGDAARDFAEETSGDGSADTAADSGPAGDAAGWTEVQALLAARAAQAGVSAFGFTVWDAADRRLYEYAAGGFTPDTRVAIASASKLVASLVIFDVIRRGQLTLDSTTGQVLGWTGDNAGITLRHLLSFTSGLKREAACTVNPLVTLAACVQTIAATPVEAPPGTRFDYGSTHLHVAARMAEVATGRTWDQLFGEILRVPLGLPEEVAFFTFPKQATGRINPLIAGGMRASSNDYARLLGLAFHKGILGAVNVGTPALFDAQAREPFPGVTIGYTPFPPGRYGLGAWVMCERPADGCPLVTSPGAFGFTPWLDREGGYYAILAMELSGGSTEDRPAQFAVNLLIELQPLIRAQLGR